MRKTKKEKQDLVEKTLLTNYDSYYRLAYSYVHNEYDAMDIVQIGCINAIEKSHTLNKPEYVKTWIYRIMINETFRRINEQNKIAFLDSEQEDSAGVVDEYTDFDLEEALDHLSKKEKLIIQLKYFESLTIKEISEIMHLNESTVKSTLYRSLKKLHLDLEK